MLEYEQAFDTVFEWFKENVHNGEYEYEIYKQKDSYIRVVDVISKDSTNYRFRVILGIGYNIVLNKDSKEYRSIKELKIFQEYKEYPNTTYQKCMIVIKYPDSYDISHGYLLTLEHLSDTKYKIIELEAGERI